MIRPSTGKRRDFLELAGVTPAAPLIILNRRRTQLSECRHLLAVLSSAGESGLKRNLNFA
jgi:hypothetical protein